MALVFTWLGGYQAAVTLISLALAILLLTTRPDRFQNRALAVLLVMFGLMGFGSQGLIQLTDDRSLAYASAALLYALGAGVSFAYLAFVGTFASPLARPFRGAFVRRLLLVLTVVAAVVAASRPEHFVPDLARFPGSAVWTHIPTGAGLWLWYVVAAVVVYGFFAAISTLQHAPAGGPLRKQALIFAAAFGIRDAWYVGALLAIPLADAPWTAELIQYQFPSLTLFVTGLLAYGILRYQMFDIELKIKWSIKQATIVGAFVVVFVLVSEGAEALLAGQYGPLAGLVAAGVLAFAFRPLERFAQRVADSAMPRVRDTREYRTVRKREVYRAALESAFQDGVVTDGERDVLATLAVQLGLSVGDARAIEREAARG